MPASIFSPPIPKIESNETNSIIPSDEEVQSEYYLFLNGLFAFFQISLVPAEYELIFKHTKVTGLPGTTSASLSTDTLVLNKVSVAWNVLCFYIYNSINLT